MDIPFEGNLISCQMIQDFFVLHEEHFYIFQKTYLHKYYSINKDMPYFHHENNNFAEFLLIALGFARSTFSS